MFGPSSRIVAVDDGPFERRRGSPVRLVAVLMCGAQRVDGIMLGRTTQDGFAATRAIVRMLTTGRFAGQAQALLTDGVAVGGFNVLDLPRLAADLGIPVIAVMRRRPDLAAVRRALSHMPQAERRIKTLLAAGPIHDADSLWFQVAGASVSTARRILAVARGGTRYPESLRVAHLVAGAVTTGASRGRP